MSVTIQGNTSTVISNNSAPEGTSEIAKITRQIQVLTEKLGKISSEEGMTTQQKKEMAALVQKQIESLRAQLEQLLRLNRPGFPGEYFICELRLPDHRFRWKHNKLFLLLPEEYGPAFPAIVDCYTSPPT